MNRFFINTYFVGMSHGIKNRLIVFKINQINIIIKNKNTIFPTKLSKCVNILFNII